MDIAKSILTRAKFRLRLTDTQEQDSYISKLVEEGARSLDATDTYIISCEESKIECNSAELPANYDELICFKLNPSNSCSGCCGQILSTTTEQTGTMAQNCQCVNYYYYNNSYAQTKNGVSCGWYKNYFGIENKHITFPSTITATTITTYFRGWNADGNGIMIPTQEQERALSAYAAFQYALESPAGVYQKYQIDQWNAEWKAQKGQLHGKKNEREARMRDIELETIMNSVVYMKADFGWGR